MPPKGKGIQVPVTPKQQQKKQQVLPQTPKQQQKINSINDLTPEEHLQHNKNYMTPSRVKRLHILNPDGTPEITCGDVTLTPEAYQAYLKGTDIYTYLRESDPNPEPGAAERVEDQDTTPYVPIGTYAKPSYGDKKPFVPIIYQRREDGSIMRDHTGSPIHAETPPPPTPTSTFKGRADDRPSPKTPTRKRRNNPLPVSIPTDTEDPPSGPSTPPNKPSVHFQDTEATPKPIPHASEPTYDSEMSEAEFETVAEMSIAEVVTHLFNRIKKLERATKTPPPPTKYHNNPALVEKLAILTTKVAELERKFRTAPPPPPTTGRPPPGLRALPPPPAASPKNSWAQVASKKASKPTTKNPTTTTPAAPVKRDRTLIITRDGSPIPAEITPLFLHNQINAALPRALIAEVRFTPNLHVQLIAVANTTSDTLLKSRTKLEETIRTILPSATSLQKEVHVIQVVIHNIPTTIP
ncbi:hypothetical protein Q9L58_010634, partial [Maublancomyces gigas]